MNFVLFHRQQLLEQILAATRRINVLDANLATGNMGTEEREQAIAEREQPSERVRQLLRQLDVVRDAERQLRQRERDDDNDDDEKQGVPRYQSASPYRSIQRARDGANTP
ncbi:hypothetical protein niasHS_000475 [Heterodera schachtii]|uniref:Uncharacterized protein n=1 Tax=Heterodera schachtii TaxID=97005 RepID=A0ABD2K714_HETSC